MLHINFVDESYTVNSLNLVQKCQRRNHLQNFINLISSECVEKKKKDKLCFPNHYKSLLNLKNGQVAIFKKLFRREAPILGVLESVFNPIPSGTSDSKHLILNSCLLPYLSFFNLPPSYPSQTSGSALTPSDLPYLCSDIPCWFYLLTSSLVHLLLSL